VPSLAAAADAPAPSRGASVSPVANQPSTIQNQEAAPPCSTAARYDPRGDCYKCINCWNTSGLRPRQGVRD